MGVSSHQIRLSKINEISQNFKQLGCIVSDVSLYIYIYIFSFLGSMVCMNVSGENRTKYVKDMIG